MVGRFIKIGSFPPLVSPEEVAAVIGDSPSTLVELPASRPDPHRLMDALAEALPGRFLVGFPSAASEVRVWATQPELKVAPRAFPSMARMTYRRGEAMVAALASDLGLDVGQLSPENHVLCCLADGEGVGEELVAASLAAAAAGLPLVGGSAVRAGLWADGAPCPGGVVVYLITTPVPIRTFLVHPYEPTEQRVVVTEVGDGGRHVLGLDGYPALERYLELTGQEADELMQPFNPWTFGWTVSGFTVLRPVQRVRPPGLELCGAVTEGSVLRLMRRGGDEVIAERLRQVTGGAPAYAMVCSHLREVPGMMDRLHDAGLQAFFGAGQLLGPTFSSQAVAGITWAAP